jgi:hypothetical protein
MDRMIGGRRSGFPNEFWRVPKWALGTDLGLCRKFPKLAKFLLMKDLLGIERAADIGAARAIERCMSAFHMTS